MEDKIKTPKTHPNHDVVGHHFAGYNVKNNRTEVYFCDSYDPRLGYWMTNTNDETDRKNVSERAINATFHEVEDRTTYWLSRRGARIEKTLLAQKP